MKEFLQIIFGTYTLAQLLGYTWFFIIGWILYSLKENSERDKYSVRTPRRWKAGFWWGDNWRRYLITVISTYLLFRFYSELAGHDLTYFECVLLGMTGDGIGDTAKRRISLAQADREKLLQKYEN